MKNLIVLFLLIICLPVFAQNGLQKQFEKDFNTQKSLLLDLINNDFNVYYSGGKSFYGYILYAIDENSNKKLDLMYLENIKSNYEKTFKNQKINLLSCIIIEDNDFKQITDDTKQFISLYNSMCYKN